MVYLARGKRGGEPTAAYEEDPTGITAKVQAQLQGGGREHPPVSDPTIIKRRKKTRADKKAAKVLVTAFTGGGAPPVGGGGQGAPPGGGADNRTHPNSQNGKYITSREGVEICFTFAKNGRNACPEPCRNKRAHLSARECTAARNATVRTIRARAKEAKGAGRLRSVRQASRGKRAPRGREPWP